ncbi:uncharacterized protein MONOS_3615 [Monocercomonoides exilis]|uniref:uncharacterized protein n=1 Tax=Monocercomonoides exilis TaxID=2049356 RepID=UPI00355A4C3F|nr:hypothetical protein MONOS_3615 [Monocercomonoides exilis]|eukprot:MONOS_3615.1-p1 / transcript=MONOS_3615.1 / gene=MONOS_3615 / organism=Monocercomonoides_exilis_PA203 / gene_product=unspecified product / transcript_product=unspecified product / location=Mono_scaffold00086:97477-99252(-) / protein_length=592 / sequence_SO=supercontig / SO=protein_coding / is_pseudo=false
MDKDESLNQEDIIQSEQNEELQEIEEEEQPSEPLEDHDEGNDNQGEISQQHEDNEEQLQEEQEELNEIDNQGENEEITEDNNISEYNGNEQVSGNEETENTEVVEPAPETGATDSEISASEKSLNNSPSTSNPLRKSIEQVASLIHTQNDEFIQQQANQKPSIYDSSASSLYYFTQRAMPPPINIINETRFRQMMKQPLRPIFTMDTLSCASLEEICANVLQPSQGEGDSLLSMLRDLKIRKSERLEEFRRRSEQREEQAKQEAEKERQREKERMNERMKQLAKEKEAEAKANVESPTKKLNPVINPQRRSLTPPIRIHAPQGSSSASGISKKPLPPVRDAPNSAESRGRPGVRSVGAVGSYRGYAAGVGGNPSAKSGASNASGAMPVRRHPASASPVRGGAAANPSNFANQSNAAAAQAGGKGGKGEQTRFGFIKSKGKSEAAPHTGKGADSSAFGRDNLAPLKGPLPSSSSMMSNVGVTTGKGEMAVPLSALQSGAIPVTGTFMHPSGVRYAVIPISSGPPSGEGSKAARGGAKGVGRGGPSAPLPSQQSSHQITQKAPSGHAASGAAASKVQPQRQGSYAAQARHKKS